MTTNIQSPVSRAVSRALAEAEIRRMEMSRSLSADKVANLLSQQADVAAASPLPYDQLLAIALRAAARTGALESPTLEALRARPDCLQRQRIAREVFASPPEERFKAVLKAAPDWELKRASRRAGRDTRSQAAWLRSAADLGRSLWDHPALPATPALRNAILACAAILAQRADALAPPERAPAPTAFPPIQPAFEEA